MTHSMKWKLILTYALIIAGGIAGFVLSARSPWYVRLLITFGALIVSMLVVSAAILVISGDT